MWNSDETVYENTVYSTPGKCVLDREIHVCKFCKKAKVNNLEGMLEILQVKVDGDILAKDQYAIENGRIVFRQMLTAIINPRKSTFWDYWLYGSKRESLFPITYRLEIIGTHKNKKRNTYHGFPYVSS